MKFGNPGVGIGIAATAAVLGVAAGLSAHTDDPKASAVLPPTYTGPAYRAAVDGPKAAGGFDAVGMTLMSNIPVNDFAGEHSIANDCWGYVSPSGREYAIVGLQRGNGFVEITDPSNAQIIETIAGPRSTWGDIKTYSHYCYAVTENDEGIGIQVIDLSAIDDGTVTVVNEIDDGSGTAASHNIVIDEEAGLLYRVGGYYYGCGVYDLNVDPVDPPFVGSWSDRYIHDAQSVTYTEGKYAGRTILFACTGDNGGWENPALELLDITDPSEIFTVGTRTSYSNSVYSHQVWLDDTLQYAYLNDELDESSFATPTTTRIFDVSDIEDVSVAGTFGNGLDVIDHNLFFDRGLIFEANYTSGIRVFDASDRLNPVEIAYFDTRPEGDEVDFYALWGNYPFFPSGTVIGSDEQRGLFVWEVDARQSDCVADIDGNGTVDTADLVDLLAAWGPCAGCPADITGDDTVDTADLVALLAAWGPCK
jgi:choice-of-anchor B domain-containing protein